MGITNIYELMQGIMPIKDLTVVLLNLLALEGCDGENDNKANIESTCVPNEELPNSECLAEDLFASCDLYICGASFADVVVDFCFPNEVDRSDCQVTDCVTITCPDDNTTVTDLTISEDGGSRGRVIRSNSEESPLDSYTQVQPDIN